MLVDNAEEVIKEFSFYFNLPEKDLTDAQFLKLINYCWVNHVDMNFDNWPDYEDLEWIRGTEYKYQVIHMLARGHGRQKKHFCDCTWENEIHDLLKEE